MYKSFIYHRDSHYLRWRTSTYILCRYLLNSFTVNDFSRRRGLDISRRQYPCSMCQLIPLFSYHDVWSSLVTFSLRNLRIYKYRREFDNIWHSALVFGSNFSAQSRIRWIRCWYVSQPRRLVFSGSNFIAKSSLLACFLVWVQISLPKSMIMWLTNNRRGLYRFVVYEGIMLYIVIDNTNQGYCIASWTINKQSFSLFLVFSLYPGNIEIIDGHFFFYFSAKAKTSELKIWFHDHSKTISYVHTSAGYKGHKRRKPMCGEVQWNFTSLNINRRNEYQQK